MKTTYLIDHKIMNFGTHWNLHYLVKFHSLDTISYGTVLQLTEEEFLILKLKGCLLEDIFNLRSTECLLVRNEWVRQAKFIFVNIKYNNATFDDLTKLANAMNDL